MFWKTILLGAFALEVLGSPVRDSPGSSYDHDLEWISKDSSLPKVVYAQDCPLKCSHTNLAHSIYSSGGTILSASNYSRLDNIHYGSGVGPTAQQMIGNVSEVLDVAQLAIIKFPVSGGSASLNSSTYLNISQHANRHLCSEGSDIVGAIMFHGTDTLEETVSSHFQEYPLAWFGLEMCLS